MADKGDTVFFAGYGSVIIILGLVLFMYSMGLFDLLCSLEPDASRGKASTGKTILLNLRNFSVSPHENMNRNLVGAKANLAREVATLAEEKQAAIAGRRREREEAIREQWADVEKRYQRAVEIATSTGEGR